MRAAPARRSGVMSCAVTSGVRMSCAVTSGVMMSCAVTSGVMSCAVMSEV